MIVINETFTSPYETQKYVNACEARFENSLKEAAERIAAAHDNGVSCIALAGPSCSGKTTTANRLIQLLSLRGLRVRTISIDDFFRDTDIRAREATDHGKDDDKIDFESVDAIDLDCLGECVRGITEGRPVYLPRFSFPTGRRSAYHRMETREADLFLFEGIQAVYPDVIALFRKDSLLRLFINVADDITVNGISFTRREVRLYRRLVRDYHFRNASPEFTFFLWKNVVRNEELNILPFAEDADISINSLLPYELSVIKEPLLFVLSHLSGGSCYEEERRRITAKLKPIPAISTSVIPADSICREFLG